MSFKADWTAGPSANGRKCLPESVSRWRKTATNAAVGISKFDIDDESKSSSPDHHLPLHNDALNKAKEHLTGTSGRGSSQKTEAYVLKLSNLTKANSHKSTNNTQK
jgi:hypothetical protein